jgi:membrane associated rhomboid family serine protease
MDPRFWPPGGMPPRRGRRDPYALWTLIALMQQARALPAGRQPVTLALAAAQCAIHFRALLAPQLDAALPQHVLIRALGLLPARVFAGEWWRLLAAPLLHVDDLHLYYNMASFLVKGAQLEPQMGSRKFAALLARLAVGAAALHAALAAALAHLAPGTFADEVRARRRGARRRGARGAERTDADSLPSG